MIDRVVLTPSFQGSGLEFKSIQIQDLYLTYLPEEEKKFHLKEFEKDPGYMPIFDFAATSIVVAIMWQFNQIGHLDLEHEYFATLLSQDIQTIEDTFANKFCLEFFNGRLSADSPEVYEAIKDIFDYYFTFFIRDKVLPNVKLKTHRSKKANFNIKFDEALNNMEDMLKALLSRPTINRLNKKEVNTLLQVLHPTSFIYKWVNTQGESDLEQVEFPAKHLSYITEANAIVSMLRCLCEVYQSKSALKKAKYSKSRKHYDLAFMCLCLISKAQDFIDKAVESARESIFHTLEEDFAHKYNQHVRFEKGVFNSDLYRSKAKQDIDSLRAQINAKHTIVYKTDDLIIDSLGSDEFLEEDTSLIKQETSEQTVNTEEENFSYEISRLNALEHFKIEAELRHRAFYDCYSQLSTTHMSSSNYVNLKIEWERIQFEQFRAGKKHLHTDSINTELDVRERTQFLHREINTLMYKNAVMRQALNNFFQADKEL